VPAPGADATEEALLAHCRRVMPSYMVPSEFRLHDNLPRTASGKIDRKQLAEEVLS
jgi:long-chain acyl-CoA synthetase